MLDLWCTGCMMGKKKKKIERGGEKRTEECRVPWSVLMKTTAAELQRQTGITTKTRCGMEEGLEPAAEKCALA